MSVDLLVQPAVFIRATVYDDGKKGFAAALPFLSFSLAINTGDIWDRGPVFFLLPHHYYRIFSFHLHGLLVSEKLALLVAPLTAAIYFQYSRRIFMVT